MSERLFYVYQILTTFNKMTFMSEVVPFLSNNDNLQQDDVYVRGCSISIKYWQHLTSWRLCQRLFYFYQILTTFNMLTSMSEVVLFLSNTDNIQQVDVYVSVCSISIKYWQPSTRLLLYQRLFSVSNTDNIEQIEVYVREIVLCLSNIDNLQQDDVYVRGCSISIKYWQHSTSWLLYQRLFSVYQILTTFNKLTFMSDVVLCLSNTDNIQHVDAYVRVVLFLSNTDNFQQVDVYGRVCSISIKYWQHSTTRCLCQSCSISIKYWQPSRSWRLCQRLVCVYQTLTIFN
jgi:hypothetical protein